MRSDHWKLDEKGSLPHVRKGHLISQLSPPEEGASHHMLVGIENASFEIDLTVGNVLKGIRQALLGMRSREIDQKSSEMYVLETEPRYVG